MRFGLIITNYRNKRRECFLNQKKNESNFVLEENAFLNSTLVHISQVNCTLKYSSWLCVPEAELKVSLNWHVCNNEDSSSNACLHVSQMIVFSHIVDNTIICLRRYTFPCILAADWFIFDVHQCLDSINFFLAISVNWGFRKVAFAGMVYVLIMLLWEKSQWGA